MRIEDLEHKIKELPTLPMVVHHINIESQRDTFTSKILAGIIEKDPPISAKLIRLANSAYYGFSRQVTSLDRAITLLGFNTVKNIACTLAISKFFSNDTLDDVDMEGLWSHCLGTAVSARILVKKIAPHLTEEAFLGGILHDIGSIIIVDNFPEMASKTFQIMREKKISQNDAEKQVLGFTHTSAGGYLTDKWNFPSRFQRIIRLHHNPPLKLIEPDDEDNILLMAVYVGNQLAKMLNLGASLDPVMSGVMPIAWKNLGVEPKNLQELKKEIKINFKETAHEWTDI